MITASDLRGCTSVHHVCRLLDRLGYETSMFRVETSDWERLEILPALPGDSTLYHLTQKGSSALFLLDSREPLNEVCRGFIARYVAHNGVARPVVLNFASDSRRLSIHAAGSRKRARRLDLCLEQPKQQDVDALNMIELYGEKSSAPVSELFDRALDRESLTRAFFTRFRSAIEELTAALIASCWSQSGKECADEALLILSRLLFLYFIQEKGWLDGNRRFVMDQFRRCIALEQEFFSTVLAPLFFGCLNTPVGRRVSPVRVLGRIPYLNGGLFEPSAFERLHPAITVTNALMQSVLEDVFEHFSFSVQESADEAAVIDPEMLGKVFESLMHGDERLRSGSFYTPRSVVDALTMRALVYFCAGEDERLVATLRSALQSEDSLELSADAASAMLVRLEKLTVLDPACGSGAFLLSALRMIERLIRRLSATVGRVVVRDLRQQIVERSLYGVDLKPEAVRLCELRLWLSIVSETALDSEDVPPLPNLDRNVMQGNSLITPLDFLGGGRAEIYRSWREALRGRAELTKSYRTSTPAKRPALARALRASDLSVAGALLDAAISADERELEMIGSQKHLLAHPSVEPNGSAFLLARLQETRAYREQVMRGELGFFAYDSHFSHVMAEGGFNLVIGNPPWIRSQRMDGNSRQMLAARYRCFRGAKTGRFHQPDIAVAFCERALTLCSSAGVASFLLPSKILNAAYARELRELLFERGSLVALEDWSDESRHLFEADTFPLGVTFARSRPSGSVVSMSRGDLHYSTRPEALSIHGDASEWSIMPPECMRVLQRVRSEQSTFQQVLGRMPLMGVKTGANARFFLTDVEVKGGEVLLGKEELALPINAVCRLVRGRDLRRWKPEHSTWMLWPPLRGWDARLPWVQRLAARLWVNPTALRLSYVRPEHLGIKVVWKDLSRGLQAVVLPESVEVNGASFALIPNQTTYFIDAVSMDEAYFLSAILNSTLTDVFAVSMAERAKDFHYRYFAATVALIPMPRIDRRSAAFHDLVRLARRAHQGEQVAEEIDDIIFGLVGVNPGERILLQRYLLDRLGRA